MKYYTILSLQLCVFWTVKQSWVQLGILGLWVLANRECRCDSSLMNKLYASLCESDCNYYFIHKETSDFTSTLLSLYCQTKWNKYIHIYYIYIYESTVSLFIQTIVSDTRLAYCQHQHRSDFPYRYRHGEQWPLPHFLSPYNTHIWSRPSLDLYCTCTVS